MSSVMHKLRCQWFHDTTSALVYSLLTQQDRAHEELSSPFNEQTAFILRQHARMPDYLRGVLKLMTIGFDLSALPKGGPFHAQHPQLRRRRLARWKTSRWSLCRNFIRYFESLAALSLYSRLDSSPKPPSEPTNSFALTRLIGDPPRELRCEIAVIGSGPGGSITACLLAEAGRDVLLIEEGEAKGLASCAPFSVEEMEQKYRNGGQTVAMGANKIAYVEGRCVGGGSEVNSGLYHRTPPEVLQAWKKRFAVQDLSEDDLLPHFEQCERDVSVSTLVFPAPPASLKLYHGAQKLGWKSLEVPRWFKPDTKKPGGGTRQSMTQTFVPRMLKAGGRLLPNTRVLRLRRGGSSGWHLLACRSPKGQIRVTASEVFICAGAVQTPALLRRSGIRRNVGNSLQLHPTLKLTASFPDVVNTAGMGVPVHQVKEFTPEISFGCSISSPPYLGLGLIDYPGEHAKVANSWSKMASYYTMTAGSGRGTVRLLPGFNDPLVRYHLTEQDRKALADGARKLAELLFEAGATSVTPATPGLPMIRGRDELNRLPAVLPTGIAGLMTIHLFASCPMGEDRSRCAVDSFGRVHDVANLHINDASILCGAPGVNPQGTIMALARRNTLRFLTN